MNRDWRERRKRTERRWKKHQRQKNKARCRASPAIQKVRRQKAARQMVTLGAMRAGVLKGELNEVLNE